MSKTITLKDKSFRIIGYVEIKDNGDKVLKDNHFRIKGYYIADRDVTQDNCFRIVAYGDVLTSLL